MMAQKIQKKEIRSFFTPKKINWKDINEDQKQLQMQCTYILHNGRNKIITLFEDKYIKPTGFPYNVKPESESEPKYELEYE